MTTIAAENRKTLRQAVNVLCGLREITDEPSSISTLNCKNDCKALANLEPTMLTTTLMDLGGNGFQNDGKALPMQTETDSYRYGYISAEAARSDGTFAHKPGVRVVAGQKPQYVTLELRGQYGESKVVRYEPTWPQYGSYVSLYVDNWTPGERVYIVGVFLGVAWIWNNDNLISASLDLRGVGTEIGGELEVSSIDIQALEENFDADIIGRIPQGAPIWYAAGYSGDMSEKRTFYLSEKLSWDDKVLSVRGQDASMLLDNVEIAVDCDNYNSGWYMDHVIGKRIRAALASITYEEVGTPPVKEAEGLQVILYEAKAARSIISEYTGVFRDADYFRVTYVDAGRPTLTFGPVGKQWSIYADEISEFDTIIERNKKTLKMTLPEYYLQYNTDIEDVNATSGKTYFVTLDPPCPYENVWIDPAPSSYTEINCSLLKFVAAATRSYKIYGYETLANLIDANNPYSVTEANAGEEYTFDFDLPLFNMTSGGSLTKRALTYLLDRSNIVYEFTYRGNPHIQPRDIVYVEIATWENGSMTKHWETMTVDTVTLEHSEGGGLSSRIRARKGWV